MKNVNKRSLKGLLLASCMLLLAACGSEEVEKEPIHILAPSGAPALSLLSLYEIENVEIEVVQGSDVITAELAKQDSEYDMILAPVNTGAKLLSENKSQFYLDSVITWGNLYVVGTENALQEPGEFALFGEVAVPGKVIQNSMDFENISATPTYYNAVNEVQMALLSGKANVGLLAEPVATATIAKAKASGKELMILEDVQALYQKAHDSKTNGYPQAAIFVKEGKEEVCEDALSEIETFVNETAKEDAKMISSFIEKVGIETLGVPSSEIVVKTWDRQNIHYRKAKDVKKELKQFLSVFQIKFDSSMLV